MADFPDLLPPSLRGLNIEPSAADNDRKRLGQEQFFELMIAQLKNQDPLKPLESNEFLSQVAQFSTVSGIQEMQSTISQLVGSMQSTQALQASTLVGRNVLVPGNVGTFSPGAPLTGAIELPSSSGAVTVEIFAANGERVRRLELGGQERGVVRFAWDGGTDGGVTAPAGRYLVRSSAQVAGEEQALSTLTAARVESVTLKRNPPGMVLNLENLGSVGLNDVRELL